MSRRVSRNNPRSDPAALNELSKLVLGASYKVHTALGPGLLESAYEACLAHELHSIGVDVERQKLLPVRYYDILVDAGYRIDLRVSDPAGNAMLVEIKSVRQLAPIHKAQLLTYLKLSNLPLGLLLNFNVQSLRDGIKRLVCDVPE